MKTEIEIGGQMFKVTAERTLNTSTNEYYIWGILFEPATPKPHPSIGRIFETGTPIAEIANRLKESFLKDPNNQHFKHKELKEV